MNLQDRVALLTSLTAAMGFTRKELETYVTEKYPHGPTPDGRYPWSSNDGQKLLDSIHTAGTPVVDVSRNKVKPRLGE